jgi:hypothetical protein
MKVRIFRDETIALRMDEIIDNLNRLAPSFSFAVGKAAFSVPGFFVICPQTYGKLNPKINKESAKDDQVMLFTEKPYDNNYFWESQGVKKVILSLYGWDHLTSLSRNNGAVYFICAMLIRDLDVGFSHKEKNTGCINDHWQDKTGVDTGMRCAFVCERCIESFEPQATDSAKALLKDVQAILNDLSTASRSGMDICDFWGLLKRHDTFDVFMCHNSEDKPAVREMNRRLRNRGICTWLDEEQLPPGRLWQDVLEEQIESVKTAAVFVGDSGIGPWQHMEVRAFLQEFVRRKCPVIPVILKECQNVPQLPLFLSQLTWVDFRKETPDPFDRLLWGITGVKP